MTDDLLKQKQALFRAFSKKIKPFLEKYLQELSVNPGISRDIRKLCRQYIADISQFSKEYEGAVEKLGTTIFEER